MYSNPHAAAGLMITAATLAITKDENLALLIGLPLAVFSHWLLDFLKEKGMSKKEVLIYDVIPSFFYVILAFLSGYFWLFMLSWWAGNLLDLIDKKLYLTIFFPKKYKSTTYFHKHKTGIYFSLTETKKASIISSLIIFIIFTLIKLF
jgi:hypothetical protein